MMYVIARTAEKNPDIKGRTLYLTSIGLWTLNKDEARRFGKNQAEDYAKGDIDYRVVEA